MIYFVAIAKAIFTKKKLILYVNYGQALFKNNKRNKILALLRLLSDYFFFY